MQYLFKGLFKIQQLSGDCGGNNIFLSAFLIRLTRLNLSNDRLNSIPVNSLATVCTPVPRGKIEGISYSHDQVHILKSSITCWYPDYLLISNYCFFFDFDSLKATNKLEVLHLEGTKLYIIQLYYIKPVLATFCVKII